MPKYPYYLNIRKGGGNYDSPETETNLPHAFAYTFSVEGNSMLILRDGDVIYKSSGNSLLLIENGEQKTKSTIKHSFMDSFKGVLFKIADGKTKILTVSSGSKSRGELRFNIFENNELVSEAIFKNNRKPSDAILQVYLKNYLSDQLVFAVAGIIWKSLIIPPGTP